MLGLIDVLTIGNQFVANFRLLKEHPQIAVDNQLQSLFLESFGFLQAGINDVRIARDPYSRDPELGDPIGDPVFEELKAYLQHLVATSEAVAAPAPERSSAQDPAIQQVFGEYVTRKLDELTSLCLQADSPELRVQMQQICQKLGNLGENFEFLEWTNLFTACRLAIANPSNFLAQLGQSISNAVKQAQVLVLADRHQSIGITPELEALIASQNRTTRSSPPPSDDPSTWKLDESSDPMAGMVMISDGTTQKLPELISISGGKVEASGAEFQSIGHNSLNFADSLASLDTEYDADAMELNEFMSLLSDDLPSEGTWMQDDDFLDRDLPLLDLGNSDPNKFYSQMFEPDPETAATDRVDVVVTGNSAEAIVSPGSLELPSDADTYDEETFYNPDLGTFDGDFPGFWSDTELAPSQQQPGSADLDLLANIDGQLQPLSSVGDPIDLPAPDFGLDQPMSGLFSTAATAEDWAELENLPPMALAPDVPELPDLSAPNSDFAPVATPAAQVDREPQSTAEPVAWADAPASESLFLEALNYGNRPDSDSFSLSLEHLTADELPQSIVEKDQIADELNNWIDNSIEQNDLAGIGTFDLDMFGDEPPVAADSQLIDFDLDSLNEPNLGELDLDILDREPLVETADPHVTNLDLARSLATELGSNEPLVTDLDDLDLDLLVGGASRNENREPELAPGDLPMSNLDLSESSGKPLTNELESIARSPLNDDLIDFNLDLFGDKSALSDLASGDGSSDFNADRELGLSDDFSNLDFNVESDRLGDLNFDFDDLALGSSFDPSPVDLDLDFLNIGSEPVVGSSEPTAESVPLESDDNIEVTDDGAFGLDCLGATELNSDDISSLNLELDSNAESGLLDFDALSGQLELEIDNIDRTNDGALDLDSLGETELNLDETSSTNFDNLDFNLDDFSSELTDRELTLDGLDGLDLPAADLPDFGNLDALMGVTALGLGVGGAIAIGSQSSALDDLDALVGSPAPNLDDLDALVGSPA
ncbi:hypothetical protein, partial [Chamaesiphon sp. OTE_20_metabat_361]|uniref:hypothetical protein n=1 Tax=Chamaesiphon sp. OTE_20_metabat_361 TaxID=2964689 RepID=UPI00286D155C